MDMTWASALKQVRATLSRWPIIVLLPVGLILPRYPEPWGSGLALVFIGLCIGQSIRYALSVHAILKRDAQAEMIEKQCRLELVALTMQIDALMTRQLKALQDGNLGAAEEARLELEEIFAAQERVMAKWKSSETPNTK
jgi:hypothetical protein